MFSAHLRSVQCMAAPKRPAAANMEAVRAALSEILGEKAAAAVDEDDLNALLKGGYINKRMIELATSDGLKDAGVKHALVDDLLHAISGPAASGAGTRGRDAETAQPTTAAEKQSMAVLDDCLAKLQENIAIVERYKRYMTDVKVRLSFGLADLIGAEMATSRWRVCFMLWFSIFVVGSGVAYTRVAEYLQSGLGVLGWAFIAAVGIPWWLGVLREHHVDDLPYLRNKIEQASKLMRSLEQTALSFDWLLQRQRQGDLPAGSAEMVVEGWNVNRTALQEVRSLVAAAKARERRFRKLFRL